MLLPAELETTSWTRNPGLLLLDENTYVGFGAEETPWPSPKFQDQIVLQPGRSVFVDVSVKEKVVPGKFLFL